MPGTEEWPLGERLVDHPHQIQRALAEATRFKVGAPHRNLKAMKIYKFVMIIPHRVLGN